MDTTGRPALDELIAHRARFVSFVRSRVRDRAAAEDIVQSAFARAASQTRQLAGQDLMRWFYRVLRNEIIDRHRRAAAESRAVERLHRDPTAVPLVEQPRQPCGCVRQALASLPPNSRDVIEAVELAGLTPAAYGRTAGISSGNAAVRLHRARRTLAERLTGICGSCSLDGCAECDCGHSRPSVV